MTASRFKHLLFDLGGTLMHAREDWQPIQVRADQALVDELARHNIQLDAQVFRKQLQKYYEERDKDFHETTYHLVLQEMLRELGQDEAAESVLRSALDALYAITQANWQLEEDALPTLLELKSDRYHLGIFSNAGDDKDVQELVARFGIRAHFDFVLTSAASFYRKPHPRAFEIALAQWNINPAEAIMIGDSLEADMWGAQQLGMKTIWITRRAKFTAEDMHRIKPDFSIRKLSELIPTLERIALSRI